MRIGFDAPEFLVEAVLAEPGADIIVPRYIDLNERFRIHQSKQLDEGRTNERETWGGRDRVGYLLVAQAQADVGEARVGDAHDVVALQRVEVHHAVYTIRFDTQKDDDYVQLYIETNQSIHTRTDSAYLSMRLSSSGRSVARIASSMCRRAASRGNCT
jgi:hypothetical protein